jgi:hypothetical protein
VAGPSSTRGSWALVLAATGGALLIGSAFGSWAEPARVAWPSYADGVPDLISHPSDVVFRIGAALIGAAAVALAMAARRVRLPAQWAVIGALGLGALAVGLSGLEAVSHYQGFGSMVANDMTLTGLRHAAANYVELAGGSLLCVAALSSLRRPTSAAARADRGGTGWHTHRRRAGGHT